MASKILINGEVQDTVSFYDRGLHYGDGLFETIAVYENTPLCLEAHLSRLELGCEKLKLSKPQLSTIKDEIAALTASHQRAVIKIILSRGQGGRGYALPETTQPNRIVALYPWPDYPEENATIGIHVRFCQFRYGINPGLAGIKHLNRLEQIMARSEWNDAAITEGLVLDINDNIIEGTMSNVFIVKEGELYTPELTECGVVGVIREKIIELAPKLGLTVKQTKISCELLYKADEIFVCNSVIGVWPIKKVEEQTFLPGSITQTIRQLLEKQVCIARQC